MDQDFVRLEDKNEAFNYGCEELFANNFLLEDFILAFQKAANKVFYTDEESGVISHESSNMMNSLEDLKSLALECIEHSIYFTAFTVESHLDIKKISSTGRKKDFAYQGKDKLYYIAIDTLPRDVDRIIEKFRKSYADVKILCLWEPISHADIESCLS